MTNHHVRGMRMMPLAALWVGVCLAAGCEGPDPAGEDLLSGEYYYYGRGPVSDENPNGMKCDLGDGVVEIDCAGSRCDNIEMTCRTLWTQANPGEEIHTLGESIWSPWISEETAPKTPYQHNGHTVVGNMTACETSFGVPLPHRRFMKGLRTSGGYSDDISILCDTLYPEWEMDPATCRWTGEVSDGVPCPEDPNPTPGVCRWPTYEFAVGVRCTGSNCDNMSFYVCQIRRV